MPRRLPDRFSLTILGLVAAALLWLSFTPAVSTVRQIRAGEVCDQEGGESSTTDEGFVWGFIPVVTCRTTQWSGATSVFYEQVWVPFVPAVALVGGGIAFCVQRRRRPTRAAAKVAHVTKPTV
ncbi:MAG: hypothetical protein ABL953_12120 [Ilumatobacteraceae bacterium]